MSDLVLVEKDSRGVAVVTLNRPDSRNAISAELLDALNDAWQQVLDVDDIGAVVLTGAGSAFCAGMDLRDMGAGKFRKGIDFHTRLWAASTPVIAAVNGAAVTGGLELVLACDIIVASEHARFADTHARVGLMPGAGMSVLLPAAVGLRLATELSLTGRPLDAREAHAAGLVNRVVPHADLLDAAKGLAHEIAANDRRVVRKMNAMLKANSRMPAGEALSNELSNFVEHMRALAPESIEERRAAVIEKGRKQIREGENVQDG